MGPATLAALASEEMDNRARPPTNYQSGEYRAAVQIRPDGSSKHRRNLRSARSSRCCGCPKTEHGRPTASPMRRTFSVRQEQVAAGSRSTATTLFV